MAVLIFEYREICTVHKIVGEGSFLSRYYAEAKIGLTRFRRGGGGKNFIIAMPLDRNAKFFIHNVRK